MGKARRTKPMMNRQQNNQTDTYRISVSDGCIDLKVKLKKDQK